MSKEYPTVREAIQKLEHYCAYQDRCHDEVQGANQCAQGHGSTRGEECRDCESRDRSKSRSSMAAC